MILACFLFPHVFRREDNSRSQQRHSGAMSSAVLKDEAPSKKVITEARKEVTGNKQQNSQQNDESVMDLRKLAGM